LGMDNVLRRMKSLFNASGIIRDHQSVELLEIVKRYSRSVTFENSLKSYKAPLG